MKLLTVPEGYMVLNRLVDSRDVRFVLFEMLELDNLCSFEKFSDFDREMYEQILDLAEAISVNQVYTANEVADKSGVKYDPVEKKVILPEEVKDALKAYYEAGFAGLSLPMEYGGMGMPDALFQAATEYFTASGPGLTMYPHLIVGTSNLLINFGTDEQKSLYLEKLVSGEWGGSMCLTEPEAGSDVGAIKTKAVRQSDGTFLISGQKIFISAGDHNVNDNIIHMVLARIDGDLDGTKGLSLFIVPKFIVNPDGTLGKANDVFPSGVEHKMGLRNSATCTLAFGDNGSCIGYLLGNEREGMKNMFHMMNESRLYVGLQACAVSSASYMHSVAYAKNRIQGGAPIIDYPDVKRMLLWMKSNVEAMRALVYYLGYNIDMSHLLDGEEEKEAAALIDFLIPVCKAGNSDTAWLVTSEGIQVYGGYGFCSDYPVERFARDTKILAIYEGTNGIQSIDLTMRKSLLDKGQYKLNVFKKRIHETAEKARGVVDDRYIDPVVNALPELDRVLEYLGVKLAENKDAVLAKANQYRNAVVTLAYAWMHLWNLSIAEKKKSELLQGKTGEAAAAFIKDNKEAAFYEGKVLAGRYYISAEFSKFSGMIDYILNGDDSVESSFADIFTGAPEE